MLLLTHNWKYELRKTLIRLRANDWTEHDFGPCPLSNRKSGPLDWVAQKSGVVVGIWNSSRFLSQYLHTVSIDKILRVKNART